MSEARRASLQENNQLLCSEDEDLIIENHGSNINDDSVIFVGRSLASPEVIQLEDSIINVISDASVSLGSSVNVTSSPKQATRVQLFAEHKTSLEKPYSIEKVVGKETVAGLGSSNILQTNPSTFTSIISSDACKIKDSFKNNGISMVGNSCGDNDRFVVACSITDNNACTCSKTEICKEFSPSVFTAMTVSKVASNDNNGREDKENIVGAVPMILSGNTSIAETRHRNEILSISSLECSPIPKSEWRKIDASNITPIRGINALSACKVLHSTPLGAHRKFQNSSTSVKRLIVPKAIDALCNDLTSDIGDRTLECKHSNKNISSQCISGFAALHNGDHSQKPLQTLTAKTIKSNAPLSKIDVQSLVEENTSIINKKEDEECGKKNKEMVCSYPIMGRFKNISVSRSVSVLEEDILDVSEDILGLEEDVITDNEMIDEEVEISLLGLDTVRYTQLSHVEDKTLTKRDHLKNSMDDEMNKTLLEDTIHEETLVSQETNMNMKRKSLFPGLNKELVRFTDGGEIDTQTNVTTSNKTEETHFSDDKKEFAVDSRKRSSHTFLFTESESGEIVIGVDNCNFDQTTVLATSDKGVFDQVTTLEKSVTTKYDQSTVQEKPQVSTSICGDDVKDICNPLNSSIESFDLIRPQIITKEKLHACMLSEKDSRTVESQKLVVEETLSSKICNTNPKAEASCTATTKSEILSSEIVIKLGQEKRKRKLEKIMTSGQVLIQDIDPVEFIENEQKIESKPISEEMKETTEKRHKKKKTKLQLEEPTREVSNILSVAAELMHDKAKVVTNSQLEEAKEIYMNNKDGKHADQKTKSSLLDQCKDIEEKTDFNITIVVAPSNTLRNADVKGKDETNSLWEEERFVTVEDKEKSTAEIVSLMQEHAALCQNLEGNKLIQQVQKKWKCSVKKTPETNLTTALHAQRHSNSSKNTESKLQGDRYCTLDIEANLQLGSEEDLRKKAQQQLAKELHAHEQQKATKIEVEAVPSDIKLSKLASAHREQMCKLQFQQDLELSNLRKQFSSNADYRRAQILQLKKDHQIQKTDLQLRMQQELAQEKQNMTDQNAQRIDKKSCQQKNTAKQSEQEHLASNGSSQGPYVSVELFKAPQKRRKGRVITVHVPAGVAHALLMEDAVYNHFYSGEWNW